MATRNFRKKRNYYTPLKKSVKIKGEIITTRVKHIPYGATNKIISKRDSTYKNKFYEINKYFISKTKLRRKVKEYLKREYG